MPAYLFEVEPHEDRWEIRVECPHNSGWKSATFLIGDTVPSVTRVDSETHMTLAAEWRKHLAPPPAVG